MKRKANPRNLAKSKAPWGSRNTRVFFGYASPTTVRRCVNAGANPNARDEHERTPLHFATMRDDPEIVRILLNAGADPNARTKRGQTPLHHAAPLYHATHPETVRALLNAGADPNACTDDGRTPLHCTVESNTREAVQALLEAGADPNVRGKRVHVWRDTEQDSHHLYETPLYLAGSRDGATNIVQTLIDAGADVTVETDYGQDAFPVRTQEQRYPNGGDSAQREARLEHARPIRQVASPSCSTGRQSHGSSIADRRRSRRSLRIGRTAPPEEFPSPHHGPARP